LCPNLFRGFRIVGGVAFSLADLQGISILQRFENGMSEPPANWTPPPAPPPPETPQRVKSAWKPLFLILLCSLGLAAVTCAGGLSLGKDGGGPFLLSAGLLFIGVFVVTLGAIVVYFFIWIVQKLGSK
jgi:hypothetical protein